MNALVAVHAYLGCQIKEAVASKFLDFKNIFNSLAEKIASLLCKKLNELQFVFGYVNKSYSP